jgi:CBS domain containing-hemolysin-like protein
MGIIIQILITMAFSAFFSGMEIAFVSSNKLRFEMDRNNQSINSRILSIFFHNPNNFISTMLVGNNIALVIYGILMAQVIEQNLLSGLIDNHFLLVLIQTIISTLIILVTGEFLPKILPHGSISRTYSVVSALSAYDSNIFVAQNVPPPIALHRK